jgi:two-component system KDP operon response regulator KdpE
MTTRKNDMNVLAVDDDVAMTELTAMLLRTHGFTVRTANVAREAIKIVSENWPNAVVLDLMMPDMDGRQVCRKLREFSNVPIIILSALNDPESVASALDSGADDYLVKPVPSDVLAAHLKRIIKRTGRLTLPNDKVLSQWGSAPTIQTGPLHA